MYGVLPKSLPIGSLPSLEKNVRDDTIKRTRLRFVSLVFQRGGGRFWREQIFKETSEKGRQLQERESEAIWLASCSLS